MKDKDTQVCCEFGARYPPLKAAQSTTDEEGGSFFLSHPGVDKAAIARRLQPIQSGISLTEAAGIVAPWQWLVQPWMRPLKPWLKSLPTLEQQMEQLFHCHGDADLVATLPGAGPHLPPRLLLAFGEDRSRDDSAPDI